MLTTPTQRGIRLYNAVLFEGLPDAPPKQEKKGRNKNLIERRNEFLFHRYCYLSKIKQLTMPLVYSQLETELFLSTITIVEILEANAQTILLIKKQMPTVKDLREKWPTIMW